MGSTELGDHSWGSIGIQAPPTPKVYLGGHGKGTGQPHTVVQFPHCTSTLGELGLQSNPSHAAMILLLPLRRASAARLLPKGHLFCIVTRQSWVHGVCVWELPPRAWLEQPGPLEDLRGGKPILNHFQHLLC